MRMSYRIKIEWIGVDM